MFLPIQLPNAFAGYLGAQLSEQDNADGACGHEDCCNHR
jgi:hypothetical protein